MLGFLFSVPNFFLLLLTEPNEFSVVDDGVVMVGSSNNYNL